jgi:hypothetical protein
MRLAHALRSPHPPLASARASPSRCGFAHARAGKIIRAVSVRSLGPLALASLALISCARGLTRSAVSARLRALRPLRHRGSARGAPRSRLRKRRAPRATPAPARRRPAETNSCFGARRIVPAGRAAIRGRKRQHQAAALKPRGGRSTGTLRLIGTRRESRPEGGEDHRRPPHINRHDREGRRESMHRETLAQRVRKITRAIERLAAAAYKSGHSKATANAAKVSKSGFTPEEKAERLRKSRNAASLRWYHKHKKLKGPRKKTHHHELAERRRAKWSRIHTPARREAEGALKRAIGGHIDAGLGKPYDDDMRSAEQVIADYKCAHPTDDVEDAMSLIEGLRN